MYKITRQLFPFVLLCALLTSPLACDKATAPSAADPT
jgi:hypothetical protein